MFAAPAGGHASRLADTAARPVVPTSTGREARIRRSIRPTSSHRPPMTTAQLLIGIHAVESALNHDADNLVELYI
ncbi:hypothetical protein, partial [Dokdonella sp.]|uniref:hypothetical protein n=1 Tax=Dokdonella sp. TaxID=2291710 RepID=UPI0031C433AF|nr:hypothetical protein [Dokdonella sp.]